ncbi:MAG: class I SAM-dependent methyltransferase [Chloroflexi bacterium]|nr:class I SAM-dependent methyltransferase [Chloroflexota bacterium]
MKVKKTPVMKGHRWYAATYDSMMRGAERGALGRARRLIAGRATGRVLEIGTGTGANFPYYKTAEKIVATDPDPYMLRRAQRRARTLGSDVELLQCCAEALPFAQASFDTVVSTLVLCTVADQTQALKEVKRILKPDGTFRFIEHVRAQGSGGHLQDVLTPLWRHLAAGCHLNRRSAGGIQSAGFQIVDFQVTSMLLQPLVIGAAIQKGRKGGIAA